MVSEICLLPLEIGMGAIDKVLESLDLGHVTVDPGRVENASVEYRGLVPLRTRMSHPEGVDRRKLCRAKEVGDFKISVSVLVAVETDRVWMMLGSQGAARQHKDWKRT